MFNLSHLKLFVGAAVLSTAAIACAPPEMTNVRSEPAMKAKVSSALSSSQSQSQLGIARWHSTVLSGADGKKAGTFDGQDAKGKVRFLATIREDRKTSTLHIESILPKKGEWVYDAKNHKVVRSTIPASTMTLMSAYASDWRAQDPSIAPASTSTHAGIRATAGAKRPGGGSSKVGPDDEVASAMNYWAIQLGHKFGMINDRLYDIYMDQELGTNTYDPKNYDEKGKRIEPKAEEPKTEEKTTDEKTTEEKTTEEKTTEETPAEKTEETPAEKTEETPAEKTEETPAEKTEETPAEKTEETPAEKTEETPAEKTEETPEEKTEETPEEKTDDLPKDNGDNLDEVPEQQEQVGNDFGDENLPAGDDVGTAIIAKHTANKTPNTRCKTSATSKSTGIRACLHY